MIMEADEIIGEIFSTLEKNRIDENTLIVLMSDNGADQSTNFTSAIYGHSQNALDFKGRKNIQDWFISINLLNKFCIIQFFHNKKTNLKPK